MTLFSIVYEQCYVASISITLPTLKHNLNGDNLKTFHFLAFALLALLASTNALAADRNAIGDDGREILLKSSGEWQYRSTDRFATSEDGTRVRLKDNGQWEFIGNSVITKDEHIRTTNLDIKLNKVVMEVFREQLIKSTRYDSQTIFYVDLDTSSFSGPVKPNLSHFNLINVTDSRGKEYPVLSVTPQVNILEPGETFQFSIRVDGSPSGLFSIGTKYIYLTLNQAIFSTETDLEFSKRVDDIIQQQMDKPFK